jgi:type III pantothenate kinase
VLLVADIGNTQTHIGIYSGAELTSQWRVSTDPARSADELALIFQEFLSFKGLSFSKQVTGVIIGSVVPSLTAASREMVTRYFMFDPIVVEPGIKTGMSILTENPREVGADRICNAVAAFALVGGPCIALDFGTATTLDAVSEAGDYLGGSISPGIQISADALWQVAAQIQKLELIAPPSVIGRSTKDSVRAGVVLGTAAMVDGMIERMQKELGGDAPVVATGGLAPLIIAECETPIRHEPTLTLEGLRIIYERNVDSD